MTADLALTRDSILQHAQALPAAPQVLGGLCELLEDINTDLDQISDEIRVDAALSGRVIRLSNSIIFGGGAAVGSVEEAVNRVGFAEIVRLVGVATVGGLVDRALSAYGIAAAQLRESLLLHALASEALAGYTSVEPRVAYAAGLLRGVGMMVLERAARGRIGTLDAFDLKRFTTYGEWEQARFGVSSTEVCTMVLDEWRFPSELVGALEQHLAPTGQPLASVLNLAGGIVLARGLALPGETACWPVSAEKLEAAGIDETQWDAANSNAFAVFQRQRAALI
jgi:HD-like signal output (HDOD) protein